MDIAKYIVTGVALSSFFSEIEEKKIVYIVSAIIAVTIIILGLYLQKEPAVKKKRR